MTRPRPSGRICAGDWIERVMMVRTSSYCGSACRTYMVRWSGEPDTSSTATRMQNSATSSRGYGRGSGRRSDEGPMVEMVTCGDWILWYLYVIRLYHWRNLPMTK